MRDEKSLVFRSYKCQAFGLQRGKTREKQPTKQKQRVFINKIL